MLWILIRKEFTSHILGFRFITSAILCFILVLASTIVLKGDYSQRKRDFQANQAAYKRQAEGQNSYMQLEGAGISVDRPPRKMGIFFYGLEKTPDKTAQVSGMVAANFGGKLDINPVIPLFPVVDILFIVAIVMSLLAFVFSYDAISGEREEGTLKLLLSYSVPRDRLILAKWIGGYLSLIVPFLIAVLAGAILVFFSGDVGFLGLDWGALTLTFLTSLVFIAVMFSVGLFVSTRCARSSTSISILLFVWVIFALIVPNVSPYIADRISPIPPISKMENQIREEIVNLNSNFRQERQQYVREHQGVFRTPEGRKDFWEWMNKKYEELKVAMNEVSERAFEDFDRKVRAQEDVTRMFSRFSPIASYTYAATDIAGTGTAAEHRLRDALKRYRQEFKDYIAGKGEEMKEKGLPLWSGQGYDISDMPFFQYRDASLSERLSGTLTDVALLSTFAMLFFMAAFLSFLREDVI
jgi:ABC-type transport system involved in multi-copper enzyme maturation permease subunit